MIQVSHPLCDRTLISGRLHAVSEIAESMGSCNGTNNFGHVEDPDVAIVQPELAHVLSLVLTTLGRAPDIQRGITRIFHCTASPSEVINGFLLSFSCISLYSVLQSVVFIFLVISFTRRLCIDRETKRELNSFNYLMTRFKCSDVSLFHFEFKNYNTLRIC